MFYYTESETFEVEYAVTADDVEIIDVEYSIDTFTYADDIGVDVEYQAITQDGCAFCLLDKESIEEEIYGYLTNPDNFV